MRIRPNGSDLLDAVITVLRDEILPTMPAEQQYSMRMVLNAIGIARRQLSNGTDREQQEQALLTELLGIGGNPEELSRQLAASVRDGQAKSSPALKNLLWQVTWRRVEESTPRYLRQEGLL
ncbi:MAG: hypothetical protein CVV10_06380 [Gammaproteobacteria bacterium HGW-Gammaproteobacteria-14]|nr:MAG: hypothetical protein CVV10_06380 [Gammaproteobacteria bacterium HGW-Gammaproteobacteria-14]